MKELERLPTHVPGLDELLRGGIPAGRTTVVAGKSGTGKSILALHLSTSIARSARSAVFLTFEERPDDLIATADQLGMDIDQLMQDGRFTVVNLRQPVDGERVVSGEFDIKGLVDRVAAIIKKSHAQVVVIDSVTALFTPKPKEELLRAQYFHLIGQLEAMGLTVIITTEASSDYSRPTVLGVEDYISDTVIYLRNAVDGQRRRRTIEVCKYRRSGHHKGEYPFTIADKGIVVFPLDISNERLEASTERFSSGIPDLDKLTAGGWYRDSIVMVRGPSGSGKTTIAGLYAKAGAGRNERVAYYGFEETQPILLRNFRSVGIDLQPHIDGGQLHMICRYPEATSPEDLLIEMRRDLDSYKPSLIVVDSISSIEHSTSADGFRTFMIGLSSLLRHYGRSAFLVQTIGSHTESKQEPPYLSTVADAILMVDYTAEETDLRRTMRVLKMRGSAHDTRQHKIVLGDGGLRVGATAGSGKP